MNDIATAGATAANASTVEAQRAVLEQRFSERVVALPSGARVAVRECGSPDAPVIVLLHGISSGAASWLHTALLLAATHRVIAWDAPGYGQSTPLEEAAPVASDYARSLAELLPALDVRRCVLVGHSLGALMACAYSASADAAAVQRLVLISPARGYGEAGQQEARARVRRERLEALRSLGVAGLAARIDQRLLSAQASQAAREWVRWNTARLHPGGYEQAVAMLCDSELASVPPAVPVEVHCGEADVVTTPQACAQAAQKLGASFQTIAGAGHASPVEQPEAVAALLTRATTSS
jgi:pimeloyl-ACP methyl ester carboxylesterase